MGIVLYAGSGSPFAWRIWLALEHKQLPYELKMVSFSAGDTRKPEFLALNPRHKVPVLVDDGFAIYESAVIGEYLEERYPERRLFPEDLRDRTTAHRLIAEIDSYLYPATRPLSGNLYFKKPEDWDALEIAEAKDAVISELQHYEKEIRGEFFLGKQPGMVDYSLYPIIGSLHRFEMKKADLGLAAAIPPRIAAWAKRVEALPFFDKTYPPHWR